MAADSKTLDGRDIKALACPHCAVVGRLVGAGKAVSGNHHVQGYRCGACLKRTTETQLRKGITPASAPSPAPAVAPQPPSAPVAEVKPAAAAPVVQPAAVVAPDLFPYEGIPFEACPLCGEPSKERGGHFVHEGKVKRKGYYVRRWRCLGAKHTQKQTRFVEPRKGEAT